MEYTKKQNKNKNKKKQTKKERIIYSETYLVILCLIRNLYGLVDIHR